MQTSAFPIRPLFLLRTTKAELEAETVLAELRTGNIPECVSVDGDIYSYTCAVSDTLELQVSVRIQDDRWEILSWNTSASVDWNKDDSLNVWNGE